MTDPTMTAGELAAIRARHPEGDRWSVRGSGRFNLWPLPPAAPEERLNTVVVVQSDRIGGNRPLLDDVLPHVSTDIGRLLAYVAWLEGQLADRCLDDDAAQWAVRRERERCLKAAEGLRPPPAWRVTGDGLTVDSAILGVIRAIQSGEGPK